ncbi:alpha/beta fold hydrolase [Arthrobacter sp. NPDC056493]|uniref:alpha/beta fold hydrolase n=1 Tax=Arthrobacter sp. NPDC056493 TaxID=3345839 RepID=UPI00367231BC
MQASDSHVGRHKTVAVVLVHGAYHGAWCWEEVEPPLTRRGWDVSAIDLPMTSLSADGDTVRAAVRSARKRADAVLLVGHSYGGFPISQGGHEADHLAFVAAAVPDAGDCVESLAPRSGVPHLADAVIRSPDGLSTSINPDHAGTIFYHRCHPDQIAKAVARLRPRGVRTLDERIGHPAWKDIPSSYLVSSDDRSSSPGYQLERAKLIGDYAVLDTDHSPFYSATTALVEWLDALASRLASSSTDDE